jgi:hypothetical protein
MQPLAEGDPEKVGPYRLLGRLGSGGMGRVYLARSGGGRTVAVKVVHPHFATDEEFRARFRREVDSARRVGSGPDGHRWSAPVLDADADAAVPWVVTGYVAGPSLTQAVQGHGALPEHSVRVLGAGLAEALAAVHELGLVHRDVKPSNVLLALDGPRLIDFGIARATDGAASLTSTGVSVGSPGYMSPEQIFGKGVSGVSDVFSLGAVLVYAATGESPFPGDSSAALLYKVVHEEPELGAMEGGLRELAARCLEKDPSARPVPSEIAHLLAPAGAAASVATGWLPGPLVEEVSRAAVQLLNLEAAEPAGTDPVPRGHSLLGDFGPPVGWPPDSLPVADRRTEGATPAAQLPAGSHTGTSADGRSGRRVGCSVSLVVAAVAAATVGSVFLFDLLPGGDNDTRHGSVGSSPTHGASAKEVPKAFMGTWKGPLKTRDGLPDGDYIAVFGKGGTDADVLRTTSIVSFLGATPECHGVGRLVSATDRQLRIEERSDESMTESRLCTGGLAGLTFTLTAQGTLRFQSDQEGAGRPSGILTRQ